VRLKKNNIRFTTTDKKHSQAHLDAQQVSYEKFIRTLIRHLVMIEKKDPFEISCSPGKLKG